MRYVIGPLETCIAEFQAVHAETEQNRADSLNSVRANAENFGGQGPGIVIRGHDGAVGAGADRRERDAGGAQCGGDVEAAGEAGRQLCRIGLAAVGIGPHGVDHPAAG